MKNKKNGILARKIKKARDGPLKCSTGIALYFPGYQSLSTLISLVSARLLYEPKLAIRLYGCCG